MTPLSAAVILVTRAISQYKTPPLLTGSTNAPAATEGLFSRFRDGSDVVGIDQVGEAVLAQFGTLFKLGKQATTTESFLFTVEVGK